MSKKSKSNEAEVVTQAVTVANSAITDVPGVIIIRARRLRQSFPNLTLAEAIAEVKRRAHGG